MQIELKRFMVMCWLFLFATNLLKYVSHISTRQDVNAGLILIYNIRRRKKYKKKQKSFDTLTCIKLWKCPLLIELWSVVFLSFFSLISLSNFPRCLLILLLYSIFFFRWLFDYLFLLYNIQNRNHTFQQRNHFITIIVFNSFVFNPVVCP